MVGAMSGSIGEHDLARLRDCLLKNGVAVIPTDTVYGLACDPDSQLAVTRLYELKGRARAKPAAVMFFAVEAALERLPELGGRTRMALRALLPGPVTLLLDNPRQRFPLACSPGPGEPVGLLGLRVPVFEGALAPLAGLEVAAMQSSANLSGGPDPCRLQDVPAQLREGADVVLDGGELSGLASTVIDLSEYERTGDWRVVREGPLSEATVRATLAHAC